MPPLFSSIAAALLSPARHQPSPSNTDVFSVSVSDLSISECTSPQREAPQPAARMKKQHPAVSMAVAYSLFLLGRGTADASDPHLRRRTNHRQQRLPIRVDLKTRGSVNAREAYEGEMEDGEVGKREEEGIGVDDGYAPDLARASDLRGGDRDIVIVTTAAMPWMTGTSVNPALRAVYLAKDGHRVTLVVPWLVTVEEQRVVFSKGSPVFESQGEQREYIQEWGRNQVKGIEFEVLFYEGVYSNDLGSILPVRAITDVFEENDVVRDVCVLEEPEHLTWHHPGKVWTELFQYVVGIIHTNYIEYAKNFGRFGSQLAMVIMFLNVWVCRGYCHRIIKLSDAVQEFHGSITSNVHGVRENFLNIGRQRQGRFERGAYFMGKVLWAKGYRDLIDNMIEHYKVTGEELAIDFFGAGPDVEEVQREVAEQGGLGRVNFDARVANAAGSYLQSYKVFVNASNSDVVCTATAEALAMGKLVVCLEHASNAFFATFPNCITYRTREEFSAAVKDALQREAVPLSEHDAYRLTWEAATERLYDAMRLPLSKRKASRMGKALGSVHANLSKISASWIGNSKGNV